MRSRQPMLRCAVGGSARGSLTTALAEEPVARASIEIRAHIDDALRCWSEFSAAAGALPRGISASRRVDFVPLAGSSTRLDLRLVQRGPLREPAATRRALEDRLRAFKSFVEEGEPCVRLRSALR